MAKSEVAIEDLVIQDIITENTKRWAHEYVQAAGSEISAEGFREFLLTKLRTGELQKSMTPGMLEIFGGDASAAISHPVVESYIKMEATYIEKFAAQGEKGAANALRLFARAVRVDEIKAASEDAGMSFTVVSDAWAQLRHMKDKEGWAAASERVDKAFTGFAEQVQSALGETLPQGGKVVGAAKELLDVEKQKAWEADGSFVRKLFMKPKMQDGKAIMQEGKYVFEIAPGKSAVVGLGAVGGLMLLSKAFSGSSHQEPETSR